MGEVGWCRLSWTAATRAQLHQQGAAKRRADTPYNCCFTSHTRSRDCNHAFAGASANAPDLPDGVTGGGFMITKTRRQVRCVDYYWRAQLQHTKQLSSAAG